MLNFPQARLSCMDQCLLRVTRCTREVSSWTDSLSVIEAGTRRRLKWFAGKGLAQDYSSCLSFFGYTHSRAWNSSRFGAAQEGAVFSIGDLR